MRKNAVLRRGLALLVWVVLGAVTISPVFVAATSPFLDSRSFVYIVAGFAGIVCLALFLIQPLLAADYLPGLRAGQRRRGHRLVGSAIIVTVGIHVGGLFFTSPPDALDALLLISPTPFSVYGVLAMWGVVATGVLVVLRKRLMIKPTTWRVVHNCLALVVVLATCVHALQIDGTMGLTSKWVLCIAVVSVTMAILLDIRVVRPYLRTKQKCQASMPD